MLRLHTSLRKPLRMTCRHLSQQYYKLKKKSKTIDPFQVLDIREEVTTYAQVKRQFLQIAMQHHPDTTKASTDDERLEHREIFVQARQAFEMIVSDSQGNAVLKDDNSSEANDSHDMEAWFQQQTGHEMPFMDLQTMKEVAEITQKLGGDSAGLDRDGGMWTLARMVSNSVKNGGDASSVLSLEAGTVRDRSINGELRRKRRR